MTRQASQARTKPEQAHALRTSVRARRVVTPHMARVTLGGGDLDRFVPLGHDQWFRLYLPTGPGSLDRVPARLTSATYARMLVAPKGARPVLRNYTVRAHRVVGEHGPGPELDIDLVLHGSPEDGTAGPAATWAATCSPGDEVAIYDEGCIFAPQEPRVPLLLAADESALAAVAGILASVPEDTRGVAVVEVPTADDRQELTRPPGLDVRWIVRDDPADVPGRAALAAIRETPVPSGPVYAWAAGESGLATGARRHWVAEGVAKSDIAFCGYFKHGRP